MSIASILVWGVPDLLGDNGIQRQMLSPLMLHVNLNITYLGSYLAHLHRMLLPDKRQDRLLGKEGFFESVCMHV